MDLEELYSKILHEELLPAMGCTEPIAIAYASSIARDVLGTMPDYMTVECSGNVVKNVKSVTIPNTGGLKGIQAAAIAGVVAGDKEKKLEVISVIEPKQQEQIKELVQSQFCQVSCLHGEANLCIRVTCFHGDDNAFVELMHTHTNITCVKRCQEVLYEKNCDEADFNSVLTDRTCLSIEGIYQFASQGNLDRVRGLLEKQIEYNLKIAREGMENSYGASIGQTVEKSIHNRYTKGIAYAGAASDARMSGCQMAVMTNSGSGNQGITASLPVIQFAIDQNIDRERLIQALALSNLITIRIKTGIGRLSAYCGVVCAAAGAFAGIAYLEGHGTEVIDKLIQNHLATISGMVCDGAKESCAGKISLSLLSAMLGYQMACQNQAFEDGCGIVQGDIEETIDVVGYIGREGMKETDKVILDIMTR